MSPAHPITALFLDIGGVLLTDGWGLDYRTLAARTFDLDPVELESRHHQAFDTYETGKLSLDEYLARVVFHRQRAFTPVQFREFMFAQSRPHPEMLDLVRRLKAKYALKLIVVSNEGRELNAHRIQAFGLDIFRLALDVTQTPAGQIIYIENTPMFVTIAEGLGIRSILHTSYQATRAELAQAGLVEDQP